MVRKQVIVGRMVVVVTRVHRMLTTLVTTNVLVFTTGGTTRLLAEVIDLIVVVLLGLQLAPPTRGTARMLAAEIPVTVELEITFSRLEETIVVPVGLLIAPLSSPTLLLTRILLLL